MKKLTYKGITFDDYTINEGTWSQLCQLCKEKHNINEEYLDEAGSGICGIEGCENEADYYIDFPKDKYKII